MTWAVVLVSGRPSDGWISSVRVRARPRLRQTRGPEVRAGELEIVRQRIRDLELVLGLALPRHVVVAELRRHVGHVAVVVFGVAERDAAVDQPPAAEAPPHADVDTVEHLGLGARGRADHQVVELARAALIDVVVAADLVSAAVRQTRVAQAP